MRIPWAALRHVWNAEPEAVVVLVIFGLIAVGIYLLINYLIQLDRRDKAKRKLEEILWRKISEQEMNNIIQEIQRIKAIEEMYWIRR